MMSPEFFVCGETFNLRRFMDDFLAAGMIPLALSRWEIAGLEDEMMKLR